MRFQTDSSSDIDSENEDDDAILQRIRVNKLQQQEDMIPEFTIHQDRMLHNVRNTMNHKRKISHDLNLVKVEKNRCDYPKSLRSATENKKQKQPEITGEDLDGNPDKKNRASLLTEENLVVINDELIDRQVEQEGD